MIDGGGQCAPVVGACPGAELGWAAAEICALPHTFIGGFPPGAFQVIDCPMEIVDDYAISGNLHAN